MMNDSQIEAVLRRYRVADPPVGLRLAIARATVNVARVSPFAWMWGPAAAAAIVAAWLAIQFAILDQPADRVRDADVAFVGEVLGDGADAAAYVDLVAPRREEDRAVDALMGEPWPVP